MYMCIYIHNYIYMYVYIHVYMCIHMYYTSKCVNMSMFVNV